MERRIVLKKKERRNLDCRTQNNDESIHDIFYWKTKKNPLCQLEFIFVSSCEKQFEMTGFAIYDCPNKTGQNEKSHSMNLRLYFLIFSFQVSSFL
jgi:hypothetical protein